MHARFFLSNKYICFLFLLCYNKVNYYLNNPVFLNVVMLPCLFEFDYHYEVL